MLKILQEKDMWWSCRSRLWSLTDQPLPGPDWIVLQTLGFTFMQLPPCKGRGTRKCCTLPSIWWGFRGLQSLLRANCPFLDFDVLEDTFSNSGSFYGLFWGSSDWEYHKCEYEELSRQLDLGPILDFSTNVYHDLEQCTCLSCFCSLSGE